MSTRAALLGVALWSLSACSPQSGFESAADGIDPTSKSYVDGPGSQLTAGPYDRVTVDLDNDDLVHVLARRRDDADQSLTVFGLNMQTGCTLAPNAKMWLPPKPVARSRRLLPYLDAFDATGAATLHFTNIDCQIEPYSLSNVRGVIGQNYDADLVGFDAGFVVKVGGSLVLADPWNASTTVIVKDFKSWTEVGNGTGPFVVWGDSQVVVLGADMQEVARFGNHVTALGQTAQFISFLVLDDDGLHALTLSSDPTNPALFDFLLVDPDACDLPSNWSQLGWAVVHSPCGDPHLVAETVPPAAFEQRRLEASADFQGAVVMRAPQSSTDQTPVSVCFLTDVDPATGLGTLSVSRENTATVKLGDHAPLWAGLIDDPLSVWAGYAIVDVQDSVGRMIHWNWDGSSETMAEKVDVNAAVDGFLTSYDGRSGDLSKLNYDGTLSVLESGVPDFYTEVYSYANRWELHLEQYDGVRGDLMFAKEPAIEGMFERMASGVPANEYQDLGPYLAMNGFGYLGNYDEGARAGTLFVHNLSLGSTMTVATQVADFTSTYYPFPGLLYAVPSGSNAGIWFARAK